MDYFDKIDGFGGMVEAVEAGFPQREIQESAYQYQKAVERGEQTIVGVNKYAMDEETSKVQHSADRRNRPRPSTDASRPRQIHPRQRRRVPTPSKS